MGDGNALWVDQREIMHFHSDDVVDVRVTRREIAARRSEFAADDRVTLRKSTSADWLEIEMRSEADVDFVLGIIRIAAEANRRSLKR
jgi:hypothetical protein